MVSKRKGTKEDVFLGAAQQPSTYRLERMWQDVTQNPPTDFSHTWDFMKQQQQQPVSSIFWPDASSQHTPLPLREVATYSFWKPATPRPANRTGYDLPSFCLSKRETKDAFWRTSKARGKFPRYRSTMNNHLLNPSLFSVTSL